MLAYTTICGVLLWGIIRLVNDCRAEAYDKAKVNKSMMLQDKVKHNLSEYQTKCNMIKGKYDQKTR